MKNNEGYKDPTAAKAVAMEVMREKLRQQYNVTEGQRIKVAIRENDDPNCKRIKKVTVTVYAIHKHFIVLKYPAGYCESMSWMKFKQSRVDT